MSNFDELQASLQEAVKLKQGKYELAALLATQCPM